MTLKRYAAKRDAAETAIVEYLTRCGALVIRISARDVPDLLIGYRGRWSLVEVKTGKAKPTPGQRDFLELCKLRGLPALVANETFKVTDLWKP